uniref:Uncharacterized protein n=1 Tax=Lotharella oceanica TaxID=641309 RepID=A0A7S2TU04_9EUKA
MYSKVNMVSVLGSPAESASDTKVILLEGDSRERPSCGVGKGLNSDKSLKTDEKSCPNASNNEQPLPLFSGRTTKIPSKCRVIQPSFRKSVSRHTYRSIVRPVKRHHAT